jgi:hypothetical protein
MIQKYGSPRNYFEGKYLGERYVQEVKEVRARCPPRNLCESMMRKLHEGKGLESMAENQVAGLKSRRTMTKRDPKKKRLGGNVKIYAGRDAAIFEFHAQRPMSGVRMGSGEFGILFYKNGSNRGGVCLMIMTRMPEGSSVHNGMKYWKWKPVETHLEFNQWEEDDFVVWLPKIGLDLKGEYTIVTKEWSPAMLEHYEFSKIGVETMKVEEW